MTTLRPGDRGDLVADVQSRLNSILALDPPLEVDGYFGPRTRRALEAYQASSIGPNGEPLLVDGVVGPVTWWALTTDDQGAAHTGRTYGFRAGVPRHELGRALLEVVADQIGAREIGRNNAGPDVARYANGLQDVPWCAWFVTWCVGRASAALGESSPISHQGGARRVLRELEGAGCLLSADETPRAGDIVGWWRGAPDGWQGHVGIVTDCADGVLWTVEGNRGGFPAPVRQFSYVLERERRLIGFGRLGQ